jgi:hypothetical protein
LCTLFFYFSRNDLGSLQDDKNEDHRPRAPRVPNPNVVMMEEIFEEENFDNYDQEVDNIQDEILESVQMDEGESSFYIFNEQKDASI